MKKNVLEMVVALVNGQPVADMDTLRMEVNAEWAHVNAKRQANQEIYDAAHEVALEVMRGKEMSVKDIFAAGEGKWPDTFNAAKVQYALLHYWNDEIVKHDNGKAVFTYSLK